jgi:uncharacterized protein YraI
MNKKLKLMIAGGALTLLAGYANAAMVATTASDISVRSGPGEDYPEVGLATRGSDAVLDGCLDGSADYLNVMYEGAPVVLRERRSEINVPVVTYEKTSNVQSEPNPGDPNLGRVGEVDPPENVMTYIERHPGQVVRIDGDVAIGSTLPATAELVQIPDYEYSYVMVNDRRVLVEPTTRRVVYVYE